MEAAERELFERSVRAAVDRAAGADLAGELAVLGWHEALEADRPTAVGVLFEACGELGGRPPVGELMAAELRPEPATARCPLLLPMVGEVDPPGRRERDRAIVRGILPASAADVSGVLVPVSGNGGVELVVVESHELEHGPALPLDPSLGWRTVGGELGARESRPAVDVTASWANAHTLGQLALAHALVGASRRLLELARVHALERVQFGRPIAAFQAVRHRLADGLVATDAAAESVEAAWELATPAAAAAAKAIAGSAARRVGRHAQQVLAGMGFTAEHPLPALVRRTLVLDQMLGSAAALTRAIGEELLAARDLPAPLPL
ncbi:MAG: hypothetical protein JO368_04430 [Acidimicrobiales bacterium]|nr:hypothetical protein [Acidimicrobiales bacterium]